jgi:hypothetical protein
MELYYCDNARHLVCFPYSIEGLHTMAINLGIKKCWFHSGHHAHYDIPKRRIKEIQEKCIITSSQGIIEIIEMNKSLKINLDVLKQVGDKFALIDSYIEKGIKIPTELTKDFIMCSLPDNPYKDLE